MSPVTLRTPFAYVLAIFHSWICASNARLTDAAKLLDHARARFADAHAWAADRLASCPRCGERLSVRDQRAGLHARCHGG